jgi:hypothetical protein
MNCCRFAFPAAVSARAAPWGQFDQRGHGDGDVDISGGAGDGGEHLPRVLAPPLGFEQNAGIED